MNLVLLLLLLTSISIFCLNPALGTESIEVGGLLKPQDNEYREKKDLSGVWIFKQDEKNVGMKDKWYNSSLQKPIIDMPVPASYNDITQDTFLRNHIGWVWYEKYFFAPPQWNNKRISIHFGSVHYHAVVYLNSVEITQHIGGHLPFVAEVYSPGKGNLLFGKKNRLTVAVNNTLTPITLPPGEVIIHTGEDPFYPAGYTQQVTQFDFFNYAGIDRPVTLFYTNPYSYIDDITIFNTTLNSNGSCSIYYAVKLQGPEKSRDVISVSFLDDNRNSTLLDVDKPFNNNGTFQGTLLVNSNDVKLWSSTTPYLYTLKVESINDTYYIDHVGIRSFKITPTQFLINNKPFYFHGVDKHEDANIRGKGTDNPLIVKDINLFKWLHANSFRTSHYPYSDAYYELSNKNGIVIIGECPAVGMNEDIYFSNETLQHHKKVMLEMIQRDKNHPAVMMWNMANEPITGTQTAYSYFTELASFVRANDPTKRPLTITFSDSTNFYDPITCADLVDVICINRYYGWYDNPNALDLIELDLSVDLDGWNERYNKPMIVSEYGADTLPGEHSTPALMFSEEFQIEFLNRYHSVFDAYRKKFLVGELIWNFQDFETEPSDTRVNGQNHKGVFNRERIPKSSAHWLRLRYSILDKELNSQTKKLNSRMLSELIDELFQ